MNFFSGSTSGFVSSSTRETVEICIVGRRQLPLAKTFCCCCVQCRHSHCGVQMQSFRPIQKSGGDLFPGCQHCAQPLSSDSQYVALVDGKKDALL